MDLVIKKLVIEDGRLEHTVEKSAVFIKNLLIKQEVRKMVKIMRVKKGTIKPIKPFKTLDEEAAFWDTHSALDEINEGTVVGFHQAKQTNTLTIRIDKNSLQRLREDAFQKGIGPTTLARMWLMEKLQENLRRVKT